MTVSLVSPAGDRREHAVRCCICRKPTLNYGAICSACDHLHPKPARAA